MLCTPAERERLEALSETYTWRCIICMPSCAVWLFSLSKIRLIETSRDVLVILVDEVRQIFSGISSCADVYANDFFGYICIVLTSEKLASLRFGLLEITIKLQVTCLCIG